jgi:acetylornithine deacetylase/succinyl-diaminopimelate desuccinylase-like protein
MDALTGEVTELLQTLIRNKCVNDGTPASGEEFRSVDTLASYLDAPGVETQRYESLPGRASLVARIEGSDPSASSLVLMGHTDVVPVNPDGWERDPFGAELVDGMVWGRGAVDMLNTTSSMAVAFKKLASEGFKPRGTLTYFAVADEEALGLHGAKWMTENNPDDVRADYCITEFGGMQFPMPTPGGPKIAAMVGEKGTYWCKLRVRGTPAHGSSGSFRVDSALVKAAEVVRRLAAYRPPAKLHDVWRAFVERMQFPPELAEVLLDEKKLEEMCEQADLGLARTIHACTHATFAPTIMHSGVKTNIIPDVAEIQVDVRTLPGETAEETRAMLREAIGDMWEHVEVAEDNPFEASASPMETPLWDVMQDVTRKIIPDATLVPFIIIGATDSRYFRKIGVNSYGFGMLSERIPYGDFIQMFHGNNERVDTDSLRMATDLWDGIARRLLE